MPLLRAVCLVAILALVEGCGEDEKNNLVKSPAPDPGALERLMLGDALYQLDESSGGLQPSILLLRPGGGAILLPVGLCEFEVIYSKLHIPFSRPLPHDLIKSLIDTLGLSVPRIVLDTDAADSLQAHLVLHRADSNLDMAVSVGDAVAIAQRLSAEILGTQRLIVGHDFQADTTAQQTTPVSAPEPSDQAAGPARKFSAPLAQDELVEMRVLGVLQRSFSRATFVVLLDTTERIALPISVSRCQAFAVFAGLEPDVFPPTLPHDLMEDLLSLATARVTYAAVTRVEDQVFIGELGVVQGDHALVLDSRPSDAIALAVRTGAPIRVSRALLDLFGEDAAPYLATFPGQ